MIPSVASLLAEPAVESSIVVKDAVENRGLDRVFVSRLRERDVRETERDVGERERERQRD